MKPLIVVLDDYEDRMRASADWAPVEKLANVRHYTERLRGDALVDAVKDANAVVLIRDRTPFRAELLARIQDLGSSSSPARNPVISRHYRARRPVPTGDERFEAATCEITGADPRRGQAPRTTWHCGGAADGAMEGVAAGDKESAPAVASARSPDVGESPRIRHGARTGSPPGPGARRAGGAHRSSLEELLETRKW